MAPTPHGRLHPVDESEGFRLLVDSVRDYAIFRLDAEGYVASWNLGARRLKGYTADEIIGKHFSTFYPPADVAAGKCEMELQVATREGQYSEEGWRIRKDGSKFWASVVITALFDPSGELRGFAKVTRDMTERRIAEERLQRARDTAEKASQAKTEFLSRVSHELRTPLTVILGFAELMQLEGARPEQEPRLRAILRAGNHLLGLVNDVLDIASVEEGKQAFALEEVDLGSVIAETIELLTPMAKSHGIELKSGCSESCIALVDRQRVKQALLNLGSNALKYNQKGGSATLTCAHRGGRVRIEVSDTGMGIATENMRRLFEPFDRLGAERLDIDGTGLGLALSKRLIEGMGGHIGARSQLGMGSTFWLDLPRATSSSPEREEEPHQEGSLVEADPTAGASTLLYIEDNIANVELIEGILGHRPNVKMLTATQGHSGLDMAKKHTPDLILLDIHLPDIRGDVILRELKRNTITFAIPVVMVTADALPKARRTLLAAGADGFLTKPLRVREVLQVIDSYMRKPVPVH